MTGFLILVVTLGVAGAAGAIYTARTGRIRPAHASELSGGPQVLAADLAAAGVQRGERATLLQFSSTFCAPCRASSAVLAEVAGALPGVRHVEIDVADGDSALDLVRRLDIRRTPTTLILDAEGREVRRAAGVPRRAEVVAALEVAGN